MKHPTQKSQINEINSGHNSKILFKNKDIAKGKKIGSSIIQLATQTHITLMTTRKNIKSTKIKNQTNKEINPIAYKIYIIDIMRPYQGL